MTAPDSAITVHLDELPPLHDLARQWRELEHRAEPSFFLTWSWIGNWLESLGDHARQGWLLRAQRNGRLVGLAVVFDTPIRRRLLPMGRAAYINQTGLSAFDSLCIEHNGFLLDTSSPAEIQDAMFSHLCRDGSSWREVHLRDSDFDPEDAQPHPRGVRAFRRSERRECCEIRLGRVRERGGDFVSLLSAGRRAHIRRCLRAYSVVGPLELEVAQDYETARRFLDRLMALHDERWSGRGDPSGFSSPFGRAFHERMLGDALSRGEVQLLRITAGGQELGYLYSFVHEGRVCFYQSGYNYRLLDPKYSPGLVTLVLAIQHNAAQGMEVFDFLAGNQAYKATLATDRTTMVSWTVQRRSFVSVTELAMRWQARALRKAWARLKSVAVDRSLKVLSASVSSAMLIAGGCYGLESDDFEALRAIAGMALLA